MNIQWINPAITRNRAAGRAGTVGVGIVSKEDTRPVLSVTLFAATLKSAGLAIGDKVRVGVGAGAVALVKDDKGVTITKAGGKKAASGTGAIRVMMTEADAIALGIPTGERRDAPDFTLTDDGVLVLRGE